MDFTRDGQSVTPTHRAWLATTANIDPRSKFLYQGTTFRILDVQRQMDDRVGHHTRLLLYGG